MSKQKERIEAFKLATAFGRERTVQVEGCMYLNEAHLKELLQMAGVIPEDNYVLHFAAHFGNHALSDNDQLQVLWRESDA